MLDAETLDATNRFITEVGAPIFVMVILAILMLKLIGFLDKRNNAFESQQRSENDFQNAQLATLNKSIEAQQSHTAALNKLNEAFTRMDSNQRESTRGRDTLLQAQSEALVGVTQTLKTISTRITTVGEDVSETRNVVSPLEHEIREMIKSHQSIQDHVEKLVEHAGRVEKYLKMAAKYGPPQTKEEEDAEVDVEVVVVGGVVGAGHERDTGTGDDPAGR